MDVNDSRSESAQSDHNDGSKYGQSGGALPCNRNKSYQDIGSNPLAKAESTPVRPCAVIGPDRVIPPPTSDAPMKKVSIDPWLSADGVYRRLPDYPLKPAISQNPTRNISPRQTFQENMQRIMVPPNYNAIRHIEDISYNSVQDRDAAAVKNKVNVAQETKYCDVPYTVNAMTNEPKSVRDPEMYVPSVNSSLSRTAPVWPPGSVNVHAPRTYGAPELYPYPQYQSCTGPRPTIIPVNRPSRNIPEDSGYILPEHYYQDPSIRYKPFPTVKERYPQPRYEYLSNYSPISPYHPPSSVPLKYDIPKTAQPHPYSMYPHLKYVENRITDSTLDQRAAIQPAPYHIPFRNQVVHPAYGPVAGNFPQSKMHPYPPDASAKVIHPNKLPYENSNKMYIDYENARNKTYPITDSYFVNEISRVRPLKNQMPPNYAYMPPNAPQPHYRRENSQMRPYEYLPHFRNMESMNTMMGHPNQFSPNALAMSPSDSSASNDTSLTQGTAQEDCGYVSQSSTASMRSIDSTMYKQQNEYYRRYDYRYSPIVGNSPILSKPEVNSNENKEKQINVRQFFQMWNESEDDNCDDTNSKEIVIQTGSNNNTKNYQNKQVTNQDQLYVLGLVNVPSEELGKYEHIQQISKLPENIKGYNNLELLSQFEEAIESSGKSGHTVNPKEYHIPTKDNIPKQIVEVRPRPVSPLDVEAKISQSVIHKEVGCNFEIKPCSPKMMNVEVAAPAQNILGERVIEKVTNPLAMVAKSPIPVKADENLKRQDKQFCIASNASCKMIGSPYATSNNNMDSVKTNYSLQDLEINSGVCLASLPRLDNEIELNFPEVNQQFINANKKDAKSSTNICSKSTVEVESSSSKNLEARVKCDIISDSPSPMLDDPEKMSNKLIKYRKNKTNLMCVSETTQTTKAVRTDSVIIKNPENIKNIEDKYLESSINVPMNLTSQSPVNQIKPITEFTDKPNTPDCDDRDVVALDFSVNKPNNCLPMIDAEVDELTNPESHHSSDIVYENSFEDQKTRENNFDHKTDNHHSKSIVQDTDISQSIEREISMIHGLTNSQDIENVDATLIEDPAYAGVVSNDNLSYILDINNESSESRLPTTSSEIKSDDATAKDNTSGNVISDSIQGENDDIIKTNFESKDMTNESAYESDIIIMKNISNSQEKPAENGMVTASDTNELNSGERLKDVCPIFEDKTKQKVAIIDDLSKNYIDTDEISARLEKIFADSSDDESSDPSKTSIVKLSIKYHVGYQSKELYSPFIQKLLLHSEGSCSLNEILTIEHSVDNCTSKVIECAIEPTLKGTRETEIEELLNTKQEKRVDDRSISNSVADEGYTKIPDDDLSSHQQCKIKSSSTNVDMKSNVTEDVAVSTPMEEDELAEVAPKIQPEENETNVSEKLRQYSKDFQKLGYNNSSNDDTSNHTLRNQIQQPEIKEKVEDLLETATLITDLEHNGKETDISHTETSLTSTDIVDSDDKLINLAEVNTNDGLNSSVETLEVSEDCLPKIDLPLSEECCNNDQSVCSTVTPFKQDMDETISDIDNNESVCEYKEVSAKILDDYCLNDTFNNDSLLAEIKPDVTNQQKPDVLSESVILAAGLENDIKESDISDNHINDRQSEDIGQEMIGPETKTICYCDSGDNRTSKLKEIDIISQNQITNENILAEELKSSHESIIDDVNKDINIINEPIYIEKITEEPNSVLDFTGNNIIPENDRIQKTNCNNGVENVKDDQMNISKQKLLENQTESNEYKKICSEDFQKNCSRNYRKPLKRSYSDSALNSCRKDDFTKVGTDNITRLSKRQKLFELENADQDVIAENLCKIINSNRRNSVSTFYNEEDVSFCILIDDNCILTEEGDVEKICFAEIEEDCITQLGNVNEEQTIMVTSNENEMVSDIEENELDLSDSVVLHYDNDKCDGDSWLDNVACVETVVSDDVVEDEIGSINSTPEDILEETDEVSEMSNCIIDEPLDEVDYVIEDTIQEEVSLHEYESEIPSEAFHGNLIARDSFDPVNVLCADECLEKNPLESDIGELSPSPPVEDTEPHVIPDLSDSISENKENNFTGKMLMGDEDGCLENNDTLKGEVDLDPGIESTHETPTPDGVISCESTDNVFNYKHNDDVNNMTSSSPEVSSTTSEEKGSSILLKITNLNGSRISQINEIHHNKPRCKFTEKKEYSSGMPNRALLTKGAQKYIPPLKESISDLKVKLSLPEQKLLKLKQLKQSKCEPKIKNNNIPSISKKPKPNFEDVLKNIDEVQIKLHKEKSKKTKHVPKVVIKKSQNGSHYTSSSNREKFDPDLTGRKWQPWVFLEKNTFIDKMVIRNKTRAVFSHRQNTYVFAEKFKKYKSISSAKFVITHPNSGDTSKGQLKYTIRLKHTY